MGEMTSDPTAINIAFDPQVQRMRGVAYHGDTPFNVPYISEIEPGFWLGGCQHGLILPTNIVHLVSLYPWEKYTVKHSLESELSIRVYDSEDGFDIDLAMEVAEWVNNRRWESGDLLIHCQAGLNRSSFVAALALTLEGTTMDEAIRLLREKRSPAVLCNPAFEAALRNL